MNKKLLYFLLGCTISLGLGYLICQLLNSQSSINQLEVIINSTIILVIIILTSILIINENNDGVTSKLVLGMASFYFLFNILIFTNIITLPTKDVMSNFTNSSIDQVLTWGSNYDIVIEQIYENSDTIEKYHIISQDISPNTFLSEVSTLKVIVSDGPNYDKEIIVPNMIGIEVDVVSEYVNTNFLNNVEIEFITSDSPKDSVVEQSRNGVMKRSDHIKWTFSLGNFDDLLPVSIENLFNMSYFEATLWLERNGFSYNVSYEFSSTIENGFVISNSNVGEELDPKTDTIDLVISKGNEIIVPNLLEMTTSEITAWVIENKLNIVFYDSYDANVEINKVISVNVNQNDIVEEGTIIEVTTSKGPLKMEEFSSLNEFRTWAGKYDVKYTELYDYNDSVPSGTVVSYSISVGSIIGNEEEIIVNVSLGSAVVIPNFVGMSKSAITSSCYNVGLNCSFYYSGYSNVALDYATVQNKTSGIEVVKGTSISIGLSNGPAQTVSVFIQESWLGSSATSTISSLTSKLAEQSPGAIFNFVQKDSNSLPSGMIHSDSPIQGGYNTFTQGQTYTIWVVK